MDATPAPPPAKKKSGCLGKLGCLGCLGITVIAMLALFVLAIVGAGFFVKQSIEQSQIGQLFRVDSALRSAPKLAKDSVTNLDALALDAAGCRWAVTVKAERAQTLFAQFGLYTKPLGPDDPKVLMLCPSPTLTCEDVAAAWYRIHPLSKETKLWILVVDAQKMTERCHQIRNPSGSYVKDVETVPAPDAKAPKAKEPAPK